MNLQQHLDFLGWTVADLARRANINQATARRAVEGKQITGRVAQSIAAAISEARGPGSRVHVGDISELNVGG